MSKHTPTRCQACENTSKLQFWLGARVLLNNDCQGWFTEDCPLAGRLAVAHVAAFVYLSEHNPGAACLHPSCLPLSTQKGTGCPQNKPLTHAEKFRLTGLTLSRSKLVYSSQWYLQNEVRRNTNIDWDRCIVTSIPQHFQTSDLIRSKLKLRFITFIYSYRLIS